MVFENITKRISYKRLIELSRSYDDPDDLLLELTGGTSGFEEIFDEIPEGLLGVGEETGGIGGVVRVKHKLCNVLPIYPHHQGTSRLTQQF